MDEGELQFLHHTKSFFSDANNQVIITSDRKDLIDNVGHQNHSGDCNLT